ncbi:minor capsid protein [Sutcliffiella sp. FSL R7-0096]|uniref:minor capsid protein n=1 Tax=Sutcliffiella sp. FSL R7-0096 TaxID=2921670 RepID=UPI00315AC171
MVRVTVDLNNVKQKLEQKNVDRGRYALANQALADMNQYVPMDEGTLRQTATIDIDGKAINYNTPYARRLFYMYMYNYTTPGTGPRWDNKAKASHTPHWVKAFLKGADW